MASAASNTVEGTTIPPKLDYQGFYIINAFAFVSTLIFVVARLYVRRHMAKAIGPDAAGWLMFAILIGFQIAQAAYMQVNDTEYSHVFLVTVKLIFTWFFLYGMVLILLRGAFATFFLRAIPRHAYTWQRRTILIAYIVYALFTFANAFVNSFQCGNIASYNNLNTPCMDSVVLTNMCLAGTVFNVAIDWIMTLVPVSIIWSSTMTKRTKISALVIVILGAASSVISVIRIPTNSLGTFFVPDQLGRWLIYMDLALAENWVAIIAISLAGMKPLAQQIFNGRKISMLGFSVRPQTSSDNANEVNTDSTKSHVVTQVIATVDEKHAWDV